jgi:23S rRNA (cytidine1920-2'-O)/16S rRNA (cytidine1409-2'-O)-methyltransferase
MCAKAVRVRLDVLLTDRGLFESRSRAAAAVMAGEVSLGAGGTKASKAGQLVDESVEVSLVRPEHDFVSRGGVKLANALDQLGIDPLGRSALDAGASTGGFTDCLLQRGAERVFAVDVGYGELAWSLRSDPRVEVRERTNVRSMEPSDLPWPVDLVVCDVSFIALAKVLPALIACASGDYDIAAMIKPQFEVGRGLVGKGGVVRDQEVRRSALVSVAEVAVANGSSVAGFASSGLPGPKGNKETFIHLRSEDFFTSSETIAELAAKVAA